ncbi:RNA-guided endonuclease TnpB family protein [Nostoc sp. DedQUE07]|uniref:RNA-guided endonuclease TnpB family protein n=1 Tax=Nostoc sp. DedQUE07 TaxID=3075392 RepID=UPI002AD4B274|nr:RNA-guided endonuclease TnpB family protein [Nostoc sp. DedQUE07]MDZ8131919.1 RNA-guided endonuclease TnpB family protein [Nostoc sp. DedQUE07]
MKTLEFKIYPTAAQSQTIDLWLEQLKWVWNKGLELRLEAQQRRWREKCDRPLPDSLKLKWKKGKLVGCGVRKTKAGHKFCEIRACRNIENPKKFAQCEFFRSDRLPEWLRDVPTQVKSGLNDALNKAWKAYSDPKHPGRRPRFKGKYGKLKSLVNRNAGGKSKQLKPERIPGSDNGYVLFPKLGKLYVKGLFKRFLADYDYGAARIIKEPSGYYLQVCVPSVDIQLLPNNKAVGIDPGIKAVIATDQGRLVPNPGLLNKKSKRLRRLQRKLSRQLKNSNNAKKTKKLIALSYEKIRRTRNAFNHKLSTKLVREYGAIAIEDTKLQNMTRRPKAVLREDGKGYEQNGASRKAGLNRSLLDVSIGDLRAKIEVKAASWGRPVERTHAPYSSQNCHCCREKGDRRSQSEFICNNLDCIAYGVIQQADTNASRNHLLNSSFLKSGKYRSWEWKLMPLKGSETLSLQVEAIDIAPEAEYASRSPERVMQTKKPALEPEKSCIQLTLWDWALENDAGG